MKCFQSIRKNMFSDFKGLSCVLELPQQFLFDVGGVLEITFCLKEFENYLLQQDISKAIRLCLIGAGVMCAVSFIVSTLAVKWF